MINLLLANSSLILKDIIFQGTQMSNQGNDLFYIAAEKVAVINCTFNDTYTKDGRSIFTFLARNINLDHNKFFNTSIPFGKGLFYINPYPSLKDTVNFMIQSNHFQTISSQKNSANVLFIESSRIVLTATENVLVDTFSLSPAFYFANTVFVDSKISGSTLQTTQDLAVESLIYQSYSSSGDLNITDNIISSNKQIDVLFKSQDSPELNVVISNLDWSATSKKNAMRLADIDSGNLLITDTTLEDFISPEKIDKKGLFINVESKNSEAANLNLTLNKVTFKNLKFEGSTLGLIGFIGPENELIDSSRPWIFQLKNCSFISIKNIPAVYANMPINFEVLIEKTVFDSVESHFGPAFSFFAQETSNSKVTIIDSTFLNNRALKAGGAIYLTNSNYDIRENIFTNNSAGDLGGAMMLEKKQKTDLILSQNIFNNNFALVGDNIASLPTKFLTTFIFPNGTSHEIKSLQNISLRNLLKVSLKINLLDSDDHASLDISEITKRMAIITFAGQPPITTFNCTKSGCFINSLNTTLTGDFDQAKQAEIRFTSDASKLDFQQKFQILISPCMDAEHLNAFTKACDSCPKGTYSFSADQPCQKCPKDAECPGGSILMPNKGFWISTSNKTSIEILECRKDGILRCNSTLSAFEEDRINQCELGYKGVKCEACALDQGFVETGLLQCKRCKNVTASFIYTILTILGFALIKLYCINRLYKANQSLCSNVDSEEIIKENLESTYYVRLLMVSTQILSMIYLFHMETREFVGSITQLGNPTEYTRYKLECSMQFLGVAPEYYIFGSVIFLFLSPLVQFSTVVIIARLFVKRLFEPSTRYFLRLCLIYIFLSEQPGIVGFMTGFLSCSKDDPYSSPYVTIHPNTKCDTPEYTTIKYFIVIPCLIIWVIVMPIYALSSIYLKRNQLNTLSVRLPWGVLYNIYKPRYYWWGTVSMLLAISLGFTTYFFQNEIKSCLSSAFVILWVYQIAVRHAKPYKHNSWNQKEATTIGLLVLNLMLGYFTIYTPFAPLKATAYLALIIINGVMISHIVYKIMSRSIGNLVGKALKKWSDKKSGMSETITQPDSCLENGENYSRIEDQKENHPKE